MTVDPRIVAMSNSPDLPPLQDTGNDAADTALVLVSDHGFNSDDKIYSQGYNLVKLLGSRAGEVQGK